MNVLICNVPLRSEDLKTTYPPLGAMFILQTLISKGFDTTFYDINLFRPSDVQIVQHLKQQRPDVVGISATVSTSYYFTKKLTSLIKQILPNAIVIVGGAITTSSELLLRFTQADLCVIGEGEHTIVHLLKILSQTDLRLIDSELENIAGISFLDRKDKVRFTGYAPQLSVDEIPDPDYDLLDKFSRKDAYLIDSSLFPQFRYDQRFHEPFRKYKRLATVIASRGCVARCTFCHRFQKGLRVYPVDRVIKHIQLLREKYDVEFISFGDEDFGASKKWVGEFIEKIKPLNILYRISATRVDHVTLPLLKQYRDSGCVQVQHGFESGSDRILKVMEKRTLVDMNTNAALWIKEAGMQTIPSIVVGMPGETNKTISETINFLKK